MFHSRFQTKPAFNELYSPCNTSKAITPIIYVAFSRLNDHPLTKNLLKKCDAKHPEEQDCCMLSKD